MHYIIKKATDYRFKDSYKSPDHEGHICFRCVFVNHLFIFPIFLEVYFDVLPRTFNYLLVNVYARVLDMCKSSTQ